jgi:hypothetical protein
MESTIFRAIDSSDHHNNCTRDRRVKLLYVLNNNRYNSKIKEKGSVDNVLF